MPKEEVRYMRLMVFFDLPVKTKLERKDANLFRKFLQADGYDWIGIGFSWTPT